jgi:dihydrodipicolinate synthase/N-acetylneuraminate lyase
MMRLEGIVVPIVTPYRETGIDEEAAAELAEGLIRGGIHGLFVGGTTGEGPLLSVDERRALLRVVRRQAAGRVPVLAAVAAVSTDQGRALTAWAAEDGADIAVAMTPHFYHYQQAELRSYLETLLRESALPVVLYEIPERTGNRLSIDTVRALMSHERLVGFKDSSGDMGYFLRLLGVARPDVPVLMGDDALILPAVASGAAGGVCGLGNIGPEIMVNLYRAARAGDLPLGQRLQQQVIAAQDAIHAPSSIPAALKAGLIAKGIRAGVPKPPLAPLSGPEADRCCAALRAAGFLT